MGLFDNLFRDRSAERELTKQEAFAGILLAASACDGRASRAELQSLFTTTGRMRMFEAVTPHRWNGLVDALLKRIQRDGPAATVDRCAAALPDGLRECAFANACDIVLADGTVDEAEKQFLEHLHQALGLDGDTALNIVEVMIIKNKG